MAKPDSPNDRGALDEEELAVLNADKENQEFGDAFSQASGEGKTGEIPGEEDDPGSTSIAKTAGVAGIPGEGGTPAPAGDDEHPEHKEAAAIPAKPDTSAQQPGESDADYKQRYLTLQGIHKHDRESWRIREEELLGEIEKAKSPAPVTPAPDSPEAAAKAREDFIALLTPDQQEALNSYEAEFETVSKMEGLKRETAFKALKKELSDTITQFKAEMTTQMDTKIAPALNLEAELDKARHFGSIEEQHPDYETYRDDGTLDKWVETKPGYQQAAIKSVLEKGSAAEVVEVLDDFKRENNITTPNPSLSEHPNTVIDLKQRREERKQNLTSVGRGRSAVKISHASADDYDSAFDEALHK